MALPVSLTEVAAALDGLMDEFAAYIHRKTGEIAVVSISDLSILEDGGDEEDLDSPEELIPTLRSILETDEWLALPDRFDIHEWEIMRVFAEEQDADIRDDLLRALHGRGAFRYFKDLVYSGDLKERWFEFRQERLKQIAAEALDAEGIPYE
jgi:hypothetical protein